MSGTFLQRGEPAIIDKFHRTKAALSLGVDIVIELPYAYAVQSSRYFAKGAVLSLNELKVSSICFGSESGEIEPFYVCVKRLMEKCNKFEKIVRNYAYIGLYCSYVHAKADNPLGIYYISIMSFI